MAREVLRDASRPGDVFGIAAARLDGADEPEAEEALAGAGAEGRP
jgi:hypothetical protein